MDILGKKLTLSLKTQKRIYQKLFVIMLIVGIGIFPLTLTAQVQFKENELPEKGMKLVFSEDFSKGKPGKSVETLGWKVKASKGTMFTITKDHSLKITHSTTGGDEILYALPKTIKKGVLEFDVKLDNRGGGWSLKIFVGRRLTAFSSNNWAVYNSQDNSWTDVRRNLKYNRWLHCKIAFDATTGELFSALRFYINGKLLKTVSNKGFKGISEVKFGDYGPNKPLVSYIDNIKVFASPD